RLLHHRLRRGHLVVVPPGSASPERALHGGAVGARAPADPQGAAARRRTGSLAAALAIGFTASGPAPWNRNSARQGAARWSAARWEESRAVTWRGRAPSAAARPGARRCLRT